MEGINVGDEIQVNFKGRVMSWEGWRVTVMGPDGNTHWLWAGDRTAYTVIKPSYEVGEVYRDAQGRFMRYRDNPEFPWIAPTESRDETYLLDGLGFKDTKMVRPLRKVS